MFTRKSMFVALGAAVGVFVGYADAPASLPQNFESATVDAAVTTLPGWTGYGTIEETASQTLSAGAPVSGDHTKNLAVDGWVAADLTSAAATNDRQLDMLVKVARPDDALDGIGDADAKFALAIDTDGKLKYYTSSAWADLGFEAFEEGTWIRVAVLFDSAEGKCKVSVNGEAATANNGPWYPVLKNTTTIASMKVVGTTAIDDLVMGTAANSSYTPSYKDAAGNDIVIATGSTQVPLAWYDKNNVPTSAAGGAAPDNSGMTTEQKFITGSPLDGSKFELKAMTMKADDGVKATVTLPEFNVAEGYTAKLQTSADNSTWSDSSVTPVSNTAVDVPLSNGNVTYFRLVAVKNN